MIRPLESGDFLAWQGLWRGYLRFYRAPVREDVSAATFDRLVARTDGLTGLVSEDERGELIGLAHLVFHSSTWSVEPYCYLEDLFVTPSARGTSAARDLITAVFEEADRRGAARTYWQTQEYNGAARSLYDQVARRTSFIVYER
jgi:GNAT superfamily N-acetyltransferase